MARKPRLKPTDAPTKRLQPPASGAVVRMYRIGHGDCFLIAFAGEKEDKPSYVLIDCGYKPGSPGKLASPTKVKNIGADIIAATGGHIDVAIVTHEHQDHVNGFTPTNFPGLTVGEVWFAWTENPKDDIANQLRKKFRDRLLGLIDTRANLLGAGSSPPSYIDDFLEGELGDPAAQFNGLTHLAAAGKDPEKSSNKIAMKFLRGCAEGDPEFLYPHEKARRVPKSASASVYVLGPPRDIDKIDDLDPIGDESFGDDGEGHGMGAAAGGSEAGGTRTSPFPRRHVLPLGQAFDASTADGFFARHYGVEGVAPDDAPDGKTVHDNADWRRLSAVDAQDAERLALAMGNATNNASLVLAFELTKGGKVLLFVGDAQAGNWRSWSEATFTDDGTEVTARDLLGRTVVYKVGHHGSHNATLNGKADSNQPSLAWMAQGQHAAEFVALITAVEAWARQKPKPDWNHPLPAIKKALVDRAGGRVLQTDTSVSDLPPVSSGAAGWEAFRRRVKETPLYFDLIVEA